MGVPRGVSGGEWVWLMSAWVLDVPGLGRRDPEQQMQKQRRKCHLRTQEMAQISEKGHADFGAGVIFRMVPWTSTVTLA